jgi:hypothetical protein
MHGSKEVYILLVGKPEGRRLLGKARHRWRDNTEPDSRVIGCESVDWIRLTQDREWLQAVVSTVISLWVL